MFPIRDDNPTVMVPITTFLLIGLNVAAWVLLQGLATEQALARSICTLGLIPGDLLGLVEPGTRIPVSASYECVLSGSNWLTPLSSMFLHGSWLHIIGNLWFLWIFGNNVEDAMGHVRFLIFYVLCGLAAAVAQIVVDPASTVPMVGASGAIGGVMGAYVLLYPRVNVHLLIFLGFFVTTVAVPAVFMLGYWFLLQLVSGVGALDRTGGGVAFWAHVGGFVAGLVLVLLFRKPELLARHPYHGWRARAPSRSFRRLR